MRIRTTDTTTGGQRAIANLATRILATFFSRHVDLHRGRDREIVYDARDRAYFASRVRIERSPSRAEAGHYVRKEIYERKSP